MGQPFAAAVRKMLGAMVAVAKRNELHTFTVMPKRWVVERSFAWLEKRSVGGARPVLGRDPSEAPGGVDSEAVSCKP